MLPQDMQTRLSCRYLHPRRLRNLQLCSRRRAALLLLFQFKEAQALSFAEQAHGVVSLRGSAAKISRWCVPGSAGRRGCSCEARSELRCQLPRWRPPFAPLQQAAQACAAHRAACCPSPARSCPGLSNCARVYSVKALH